MTDRVLTFILGGGAGTRLKPLTLLRSKPAVPIAGKYRLIDIPMSNAINSGMSRIFVLTQYNSHSLNNHIARTYQFDRFGNGFAQLVAANQTPAGQQWFQGTADAVRQCLRYTEEVDHDAVLILSGDHLYRMNYQHFMQTHLERNADVTIACKPVTEGEASALGLMHTDHRGHITSFKEKPKGEALESMRCDLAHLGLSAREAADRPFLASMGIYIFKREVLTRLLNEEHTAATDFGGEVLPSMVGTYSMAAHVFDDYWADIGTISAFFEANIALTRRHPPFSFFDPEAPMYTRARSLPASRVYACHVESSIINEGCWLEGGSLRHSILGLRSRTSRGVSLTRVLLMGADRVQSEAEIRADQRRGLPPIGLGEDTVIENAIIDKGARIGRHCRLVNRDRLDNAEGEGWTIRDGILVVHKNAIIPDGTII